MANVTRIPKEPAEFDDYMNRTDNLQLSTYGSPPSPRFNLFGWTLDESNVWTGFRTQSNLLFAIFSDPDKTGRPARLAMNALIAKVRKYDNDKNEGKHLLDKVALNGTVDDCLTYNVVRGTSLQAAPVHHNEDPTLYVPEISFQSFALGQHTILAVCSGTTIKKLPEGMQFVQIYRCISATAPTKLSQYELIGNAKRGIYRSNFADVEPAEDEVLIAYYFGRYVSKKGKLGNPGGVIKAPVMLAVV